MFRPRPAITSAPATLSYGQQFTIGFTLPGANDSVRGVALIRPTATTHSVQMDQRYVTLNFLETSNGLLARVPSNHAQVPPGYYMLVITNQKNTPSVAS